jgi:hypothetical protein
MTPAEYAQLREQLGNATRVAQLLGIPAATILRREQSGSRITPEAAMALQFLYQRSAAAKSTNSKRWGDHESIWKQTDWTMRNRDIAKNTGRTPAAVSLARKRYAPETSRTYKTSTPNPKNKRPT